jgi:hypothetical protein
MKLSRSQKQKNQVKFINFYFILTTNIQQLNLKDSFHQKWKITNSTYQFFPFESGSFHEFIETN